MTTSRAPTLGFSLPNILLGVYCLAAVPSFAAPVVPEPLLIRFESLTARDGLTISIKVAGDQDGETIFANRNEAGVTNAQRFVSDVSVRGNGVVLPVEHLPSGWKVRHKPAQELTISYRLPPSGVTNILGTANQLRPHVSEGVLHLASMTSLVLPTGRNNSDALALEIDARNVADNTHFASSFGPGNHLHRLSVTRKKLNSALFVGGAINLSVHDTPTGSVGVVYSAMNTDVLGKYVVSDALTIIDRQREFFDDSQPWYLVSVHGGISDDPAIFLGGGMGMTNSFMMFTTAALDFSDAEQREQFRWVLAHEYFHQWNGLTLRVASQPLSDHDDTSVYWFSEGFTEFYAMRLLTRSDLQTPERARDVLNDKIYRYAGSSKRGISTQKAGELFWTDAEGEQIPYLRGYLAAWSTDIAQRRNSNGQTSLDTLMRALVSRAKVEPAFRVDNDFLASYLTDGLPEKERSELKKFIIKGGESPLTLDSFNPCMTGKKDLDSQVNAVQYDFVDRSAPQCFRH